MICICNKYCSHSTIFPWSLLVKFLWERSLGGCHGFLGLYLWLAFYFSLSNWLRKWKFPAWYTVPHYYKALTNFRATGKMLRGACCTHSIWRGNVYLVMYGDIQVSACLWIMNTRKSCNPAFYRPWWWSTTLWTRLCLCKGAPLPSLSAEANEQMVRKPNDCCSV